LLDDMSLWGKRILRVARTRKAPAQVTAG
jgi:hypothetical protein